MKFVKKPVVIDAVQWSGDNLSEVLDDLELEKAKLKSVYESASGKLLYIRTNEGTMAAHRFDWIIKGVKGELYSCAPDIFAMTYSPLGRSDEKCQTNQSI